MTVDSPDEKFVLDVLFVVDDGVVEVSEAVVLLCVIPRARTKAKRSPAAREANRHFLFFRNQGRHSEELGGLASLDMVEMEVSTLGFSDQN